MSVLKSKVYFFFQDVSLTMSNRGQLKKFIETMFKKEGKKLTSLNYVFCKDKALLEINRQYLKHDFYTDIITFDLSDSIEIAAEVYISVERVRENAKAQQTSFKAELHRVVFHGVLHLCGYKDKTRAESELMRKTEDFYLASYFK